MVWVAGADGCKAGWFRAARETETGALRFNLVGSAADLLATVPRPAILAVDIPIGLSEAGPRDCDRQARQRLGRPRSSSVFPAPIRLALSAQTREEAAAITEARDGRRVGAQAWALYAKIRQVDELLQSRRVARRQVREAHPEICFQAWAGGQAMADNKKTPAGRAARLRLAESWLGPDLLQRARGGYLKKQVADDDILDAIATLWTATRIVAGKARTLPETPPKDATGLAMEIAY